MGKRENTSIPGKAVIRRTGNQSRVTQGQNLSLVWVNWRPGKDQKCGKMDTVTANSEGASFDKDVQILSFGKKNFREMMTSY